MNWQPSELVRYGVNGIVATAVHYLVLFLSMEFFQFGSAGLANLLASIFGISISFIGNRYFVFPSSGEGILVQAVKFAGLYAAIGLLHGFTLYIWTDIYSLSYHFGFLIAVMIQFSLGYLAGKNIVFKKFDALRVESQGKFR